MIAKIENWIAVRRKGLVALLGAAAMTALQFYPQNKIVLVVIAFLTAAGVYATPNRQ